ncbi:MAG: hypothetical protein AMJ79_08610 [Phycisphaerae bacterium SM23_30]|nr:MAG: hypothetical protein AMJ79_08610 [Phycisphaerae bacterium SM23_30]
MTSKAVIKICLLLVLLLLATAAGIYWFAYDSNPTIQNVLLISLDTCRADHLSCYGFERQTTPVIDELTQTAALFQNAYTPIPLTLPAHCSMFTGTYPPFHRVLDNLNYKLSESNVTLAEILQNKGYFTGAVISSTVLNRRFGTYQGFDRYYDEFEQTIEGKENQERRGEEASRFAGEFLVEHQQEPFFLFLHYYDPHTKYEPPEPFSSEYADNLYAGEIAYTDYCIGQVLEKLENLDLLDSTLIIIVGDHGESLGEHGESEHGYYIYKSTTHIPLIIRPPGLRKSKEIEDVATLVDIVPTVLGYLGIDQPSHIQGNDLSELIRGRAAARENRYVFTESLTPTKFGCNPLLGAVTEQWNYIQTTHPELYNFRQDPLEANNLIEKESQRARLMQSNLQEMVTQIVTVSQGDNTLEMDEETRKQLESLGYVGDSIVNDTFEFDQDKKDPKDLIVYYEQRQQVNYLIADEQYDEARKACQKMLLDWPDTPNTHFLLTRIAFADGKWDETMKHGRRYLALVAVTIEENPESSGIDPTKPIAMCHNLVARAAYNLKDFDSATEHWTEALHLNPKWPEVLNYLAAAYLGQNKYDPAIKHWNEALKLKPDWIEVRNSLTELHNKLAEAFYQQSNIQQAIEHWTKSLNQKPDQAETHHNLATAFYHQARTDQALLHWHQAVQLKPDWPEALNNLAWILATINEQKLRNPAEAVRLAQRAAELTKNQNPGILDTLSVAYAAAGNFPLAVQTAQKALKLATSAGDENLADSIRQHLKLFQSGQIYLEKK